MHRTSSPGPARTCLVLAIASIASAQDPTLAVSAIPTADAAETVLIDESAAGASAGGTWVWTPRQKVRLEPGSFSVVPFLGADAPRSFPVKFALASARVAGMPITLDPALPTRSGMRWTYQHGGLEEFIDVTADHLEQSFLVRELPAQGEFELRIATESEFTVAETSDGIWFSNAFGRLEYGRAIAFDGDGKPVEITTDLVGNEIVLSISQTALAGARLPLLIDPIVSSAPIIPTDPYGPPINPDVVFDDVAQEYVVTWVRRFSATDHDVLTMRVQADLVSVPGSLTVVDISTDDWRFPSIAYNRSADACLVVAQARSFAGGQEFIAARRVSRVSAGAWFIVDAAATHGVLGNRLAPRVGGNPTGSGTTYWAVVFDYEYRTFDHDIWLQVVDDQGAVATTPPVFIDTSLDNEWRPSISRSCGVGDPATQAWLVAYQRTISEIDEDIRAAWVAWDGRVLAPGNFSIDSSASLDARPRASSPTDDIAGTRSFVVTFERVVGSDTNIAVAATSAPGSVSLPTVDLTMLEGGAALTDPQYLPVVESDGCRFTVAWFEDHPTDSFDVRASTIALVPGGLRIDESRLAIATSPGSEYEPVICSNAQSAGVPQNRHGVVWVYRNAFVQRLAMATLDGMAAGSGFNTRPTGCGGTTITVGSQAPAVGNVIAFATDAPVGLGAMLIGLPSSIPIAGCACSLGVSGWVVPDPLVARIPCDPALVGGIVSVQGFSIAAPTCFSQIEFTDTIDFTIQ